MQIRPFLLFELLYDFIDVALLEVLYALSINATGNLRAVRVSLINSPKSEGSLVCTS